MAFKGAGGVSLIEEDVAQKTESAPSLQQESIGNLSPHSQSSNPEFVQEEPYRPAVPAPTIKKLSTGNSVFICPWIGCQAEFKQKFNYTAHYFVHAGLRPFACSQCDITFVRKRDLNRHENSVHSEMKHRRKCPQCEVSFTRQDALRRHLRMRCLRVGIVSKLQLAISHQI
ncbi:hypothetical protein HK100_012018 [Physocladia obscura]|uniref:C2H2-type domain-containing protein n=1 Tax=Physocladia obscura TaxID=109957 RepID=A0AAD5XDM4_9FUNG|nr:hypothetical protein HK100_012018 [Physocladia obscura]